MTAASRKVTLEFDVRFEALVRQALAFAEEMEQLALSAPDGQVVHDCETAVIVKGRQLQSQMLTEAVARRLEAAEKKGRRCGSVHVDGRRKTKGPKRGNS